MSVKIEYAMIELVKDIHKEYLKLPATIYTPYKPINNYLDKGRYLLIEPRRKDHVGYVKVKGKDLWLYMINGKLKFRNKFYDTKGFDYKQPLLVWLEYNREPTFLLYISTGYGEHVIKYLKYEYKNNILKMSIVNDVFDATTFSYQNYNWHSFLAKSKDLTSGV
jgi:hypothetical protein